jgi:hypothetical protein
MSSLILTGRWIGFYLQEGKESPITADFLEAEDRLSGFMYDGQPDKDFTLSQTIAEAGLPSATEEQLEAKLREMVPDAPTDPIRYVSHLPTNSILQGRRTSRAVYFLKSYQGASFAGYRIGEHLIGVQQSNHQVHYEGEISADGRFLEGRWWIEPDLAQGTPGTEGRFSLPRTESGEIVSTKDGLRANEKKRPWWRFLY